MSNTVTAVPLKGPLKGPRGKPKGRQADPRALAEIRELLGDEPRRPDLLIEFLHRIQDTFQHVHARHLVALAEEMHMTTAEVYEVATFYHHFDVVRDGEIPPPPLTVRVCESIACELGGAHELIDSLTAALGEGVRVQPVPCIGRCDTAPVAVVGQNPVDNATSGQVCELVKQRKIRAELPDYLDFNTYCGQGGYQLLADCISGKRSVEEITGIIESAGLRGLGGAGFPSGRKWRIVRDQPSPRLMAVNADEGEPGTFKDRYCLETDPHRFLEGMLIAAWAVDVSAIYIYLRDEYAAGREILHREVAALQANPPCNLPEIHIRRGAGAYICGEESAMIESIEGKRGMPRLRPPYVAQVGIFGRPTLVHNLESLFWIRSLVDNGPESFSDQGRHGRKGLRSFSVSGRVQKPGVHLAPAGITMCELIDEYCGGMLPGHEFYGYLPGGASGGILPATMGDIPLDFDTLQPYGCFIGSAAIVVFSDADKARDVAVNLMRFFAHESCGQCTPCRNGTDKAVALMQSPVWDQVLIDDLSTVMQDASICGLGQAAPNPMHCVIKYFPQEIDS